MLKVLLGMAAAAIAVTAAPAAAEPSVRIHYGNGDNARHGHDRRHDGRLDRTFRDRDRRGDATVISEWYGGQWALYNNRTFAPDSYNDWWHDNPQRSYPRWMTQNENCERLWWGGGGWHC